MTASRAPMTIAPSGRANRRAAAGALVAQAVLTSPAHATTLQDTPPDRLWRESRPELARSCADATK